MLRGGTIACPDFSGKQSHITLPYYEIASNLPTHMDVRKSLSAGRPARKDVLVFRICQHTWLYKIPACLPAHKGRLSSHNLTGAKYYTQFEYFLKKIKIYLELIKQYLYICF